MLTRTLLTPLPVPVFRYLRRMLPVLVCTLVFVCGYAQGDQQEDMKQLQKNIEQLQKELKNIQGERSNLQKDLQKSETEVGELLKKIERINRDLKDQDKQLNNLHQERKTLEDARRAQQDEIAEQVASAYQLGQQSQIKLLLNQESPEQVTRMLKYHQYFLAARAQKLDNYLATLNQLDELEPKINAKTLELSNTQSVLRSQHEQLNQRQSERKQALAKINATLKTKDQELNQLNEERKQLQALLQQVSRTLASVNLPKGNESFSSRKGRLPWPTDGKLIHRYGSQRIAGQMQWNGLMILASEGKPVIAVHQGRVVFADYFLGHGLLLIVDHGEGYLSLYAHNQSLYKTTGEWVNAGEPIASVGNSGGRDEAGLYFELRHKGKPIDPGAWLARA